MGRIVGRLRQVVTRSRDVLGRRAKPKPSQGHAASARKDVTEGAGPKCRYIHPLW
jgi:hypothetical protein